jgi:hypothetical protein
VKLGCIQSVGRSGVRAVQLEREDAITCHIDLFRDCLRVVLSAPTEPNKFEFRKAVDVEGDLCLPCVASLP